MPSPWAPAVRRTAISRSYATHCRHAACSIGPATSPVDDPSEADFSVTGNTAPDLAPADDSFAGYQTEGFFDEMFTAEGEVRAPYRSLISRLRIISFEELSRRERLRDAIFRSLGITFNVYGHDAGLERVWPMDLVPRIIPADEWAHVERGLIQRVTALNRFLDDLYVGERAAIADGIVPTRARDVEPTASSARRSASPCRTAPAAWFRASTSCATATACIASSRTTSARRAASPTCSRTARR